MDGHRWTAWLERAGRIAALAAVVFGLAACNNSPHPKGSESSNTLFVAFQERTPHHLDPIASYALNETPYLMSAYETLYAYHYLKRPYTLIPRLATEIVTPRYLDKDGKPLPNDASGEVVSESVYDIPLRQGVMYSPHPAFAKGANGEYLYHALTQAQAHDKHTPWDFERTGTREMVAEDFVYTIKRHATTRIEAPVYGVFSEYVIGLKELGPKVKEADAKLRQGLDPAALDKPFLDFRQFSIEGAQALNPHLLRIRLKGKYPQWKYWMTMPFLSPVPWEADKFYSQPGMAKNSLSLDTWPVGTGPFMLTEYEQDRRLVLQRNPNYRGEPYPCEGMPEDRAAGLLADCGKRMPFVDTLVFEAEKEKVSLRAKFVQGFLDVPEIERSDWGPDFLADAADSDQVRRQYEQRGQRFPKSIEPNNWYLGFNWLDPVVGKGDTPEQQLRNRKLRHALSIAIDWEEGYGRVFTQKAGETAHGPVPPGVFGSRHGVPGHHNPVTHKLVNGQVVRRSLDEARQLLAEAGYPDGRDGKTGRPLVLNYDYQRVPTPEYKAELDWMVKQFAKLGVQLEIRATDFNQFQEKMLKGKQQIFWWGWNPDYPDPENFLFLLYGPNAKAKFEGENAANYENPEYDRLYRLQAQLDDGPERQKVIDQMVDVARQDAPWAWGYFPWAAGAFQQWVPNGKFGIFVYDHTLYYRVDPKLRAARQAEWNRPVWWPLLLIAVAALWLGWLARRGFVARERAVALASAPAGEQAA
ncbi:MAG TPA: ABC transporter substrate-binding protein [Albitalea sp.]|uniref:ABC transporter substrate-binding protein n=1 Tax=Piscinibacter sp. TaxID=1903157 RepID=UPI002ED6A5B8